MFTLYFVKQDAGSVTASRFSFLNHACMQAGMWGYAIRSCSLPSDVQSVSKQAQIGTGTGTTTLHHSSTQLYTAHKQHWAQQLVGGIARYS